MAAVTRTIDPNAAVRWIFVYNSTPKWELEYGLRHREDFDPENPLAGPVKKLETLHAIERFRTWWRDRFVSLNFHPTGDETFFPVTDEVAVQLLREW